MLALACLSLDSVGSRVPVVNLWFLSYLVDNLIFIFFFVYRSPSTDDSVYDCLSMVMGEIQSVDPKSAFCFVGDFNCHHSEWLGSRVTNAHGMAAFDFSTLTDCSQLIRRPTHRGGGILDLVMTDVPTYVRLVLVRHWVGLTILLCS